MALILYSAGVGQMSGSIGGTTFARNRFGFYSRNRTTPVNPNSSRQTAARILMAFLAEQWGESPMTPAIRLAWQTYASSFNWLNRLGSQVTLTGFNAFVQCNSARIAAGGSLITAAPAALGLPAQDPAFAVAISVATQIITVTFDDTFDWLDEDDGYLLVHMGRPVSASHSFFGGPFRVAGSIQGSSTVPPTTPDATITAPFTAVLGQQVWCSARIIREDARISTLFRAAPVLVAA